MIERVALLSIGISASITLYHVPTDLRLVLSAFSFYLGLIIAITRSRPSC